MATISRLYPSGILQTRGVLNEVFIPKSGSVQVSNAPSKYLTVANNSAFTLGTNDHTIEFWMYQTARGNYDCPFSYDGTAGQQAPNNYYMNIGNSQFYLLLGKVLGGQWSFIINCGTLPSLNEWHHYAIVRIGSTFTVYVDGISRVSATSVTDSISAQGGPMVIGAYDTSGSSGCTGYITNFRVVNGIGVYTGNFPVPKTPFNINQSVAGNIAAITGTQTKLLLRHTDSGSLLTDSSPNNFTVTNVNGAAWNSSAPAFSKMQYSYEEYRAIEFDEVNLSGIAERRKADGTHQISGQFEEDTIFEFIGSTSSTHTPTLNGSTVGTTNGSPFATSVNSYQIASQPASAPYNYVSVPGGSEFAFGTGDFTIEWFQKQTTSTSFTRLFWYGTGPTFGVSEEGATFYFWNPTLNSFSGLGTILNTWVHFAVVRIGSSLKVYRNGVQIGTSVAHAVNFTDTSSTFYIGSKANTGLQSEQFIGSITNFRVCKGLGVYTGNFTVPTSPLGQTQSANPYGGTNTSAIAAGQCTLLLNP